MSGHGAWHGVCSVPDDEMVRWPERSLWRMADRHQLPVKIVGSRDTAGDAVRPAWDGYGVWHAHDAENVARVIAEAPGNASSAALHAFWRRKP